MLKICPYHHYNLSKIKQWLDEQSVCGWELENWGIFFVKFKEAQGAEPYIYQLDMDDSQDEPSMFRREELSKCGWEYVVSIGNTREHIYRHKDKNAKQPKNESYIAFNLKKLNKELFWSGIFVLFLLCLFLGVYIIRNEFLLLQMMQQRMERLALYIFWIFLIIIQTIGEICQNVKLHKYLETYDEELRPEKERVEASYGFYFPAKLLTWLALGISVITILGLDNRQEVQTLSQADFSLKYVDLAELEGGDFKIADIFWDEYPDVNFGNRIEYIHAPFCNSYYEINQYMEYSGQGTGTQMEGLYWDVKNEKTARKLFEQVVEYYIKYSQGYYNVFRKGQYNTEENWVKLEVSDERFTEIAAVEGTGYRFEGNKQVFVRIGNQIVCLRYFGESDVETLIEAIAAKFL